MMTTKTATIDGIEMRRIEHGKHFTPEDFPEIFAEEIMALVVATKSSFQLQTSRQRTLR